MFLSGNGPARPTETHRALLHPTATHRDPDAHRNLKMDNLDWVFVSKRQYFNYDVSKNLRTAEKTFSAAKNAH